MTNHTSLYVLPQLTKANLDISFVEPPPRLPYSLLSHTPSLSVAQLQPAESLSSAPVITNPVAVAVAGKIARLVPPLSLSVRVGSARGWAITGGVQSSARDTCARP